MNTPAARSVLLTLCLLSAAGGHAQSQPQTAPAPQQPRTVARPAPRQQAAPAPSVQPQRIRQSAAAPGQLPNRIDYSGSITRMIRNAQQVVMYLPSMRRADVTEAVRLALIERGTTAIILTTENSLMEPNSYTFRLLLMGNPTYYAPAGGQPFIILDGKTYIGSGLTQAGTLYQASNTLNQQTIKWGQNILNKSKPLVAQEVMKRWSFKNLGIKLN